MRGAYYNEIDPYAAQWLRNLIAAGLIAPGDVDERSIVDVKADDLQPYKECHFFAGIGGWAQAFQLVGWPDREAWTGSCPCQPLSCAGSRQGHADERHLWPAFHALISECHPPVVFGEQVASKDGREWLAAIRADLEDAQYAVGCANLCAAGVGAPHIRQRLYWVADSQREGLSGRVLECSNQKTIITAEDGCRSIRNFQWPEGDCKSPVPVLDNGVPKLVAASVGFGNAIVPQVAAEFIAAYLETD